MRENNLLKEKRKQFLFALRHLQRTTNGRFESSIQLHQQPTTRQGIRGTSEEIQEKGYSEKDLLRYCYNSRNQASSVDLHGRESNQNQQHFIQFEILDLKRMKTFIYYVLLGKTENSSQSGYTRRHCNNHERKNQSIIS